MKTPKPLSSVPPVKDAAVGLASDLAKIDLTKFRFRIGCGLIGVAVLFFFFGHFKPALQYFTDDFPHDSWMMTWVFLALGIAFAGKEVASALETAMKALKAAFGK